MTRLAKKKKNDNLTRARQEHPKRDNPVPADHTHEPGGGSGAAAPAPVDYIDGMLHITPGIKKDPINLLNTTDAREWAIEFMRIFGDRKAEIDTGLMMTWFANAICTGIDHANKKPKGYTELFEALQSWNDWVETFLKGEDSFIMEAALKFHGARIAATKAALKKAEGG